MATNPTDPEQQPDPGMNPLAVAPANKPAHKPDDKLTDDSAIAPKDKHESPFEQRITDTDPHRDLHPDEHDDWFNEFRSPGEDMDLHETHDHRAHTGLSTGTPGTERFRPVPMWAIVGCAALIAFSFMYLGAYSGGFQSDVFTAAVNYHPVSGPPVDQNSPEAMAATGAKVFIQNCAQCHQASGLGQAGQYPPLVASEWVLGPSSRIEQILLHGIQGTIHVKGEVYNNQMPAWNASLTDKQIAQVLTYVRTKLGGNGATPITEKDMDAARDATKAHSDSWTESELLAIPADAGAPAPGAAPGTPAVANPANVTEAGNNKPSAALPGQGPAVQPAPKP